METLKVLVVEDEALIRAMLEDALENAGYGVHFAVSAKQAFDALEDQDKVFVALLTDVRLTSDVTGWDVARRARELSPAMPVVYLTGDSAADWASQGVPNSVLITKPFALAQVVTAISGLLNTDTPPSA